MSFNGQEVCIRNGIASVDGTFPSIHIQYHANPGSAPPAALFPRAHEISVEKFHLVAIGAIELNRFILTTTYSDNWDMPRRYLLSATRGYRATPEFENTLRACNIFSHVDLSTVKPTEPNLEGFLWEVVDADPRYFRLPATIQCATPSSKSLHIQDGEPLKLSLWPIPLKLSQHMQKDLVAQELIDLWHVNTGRSSYFDPVHDDGDSAVHQVFDATFDQNLTAREMIIEQAELLKGGVTGLQSAKDGPFKPPSSPVPIATVKLACALSNLIYARIPLDRNKLLSLLDDPTRAAFELWTTTAIIHSAISILWPTSEQFARINYQLQCMLSDSLVEVESGARHLDMTFEPLRLLHQGLHLDTREKWLQFSRAGSGPFCGAFMDHRQHTAVITFKGTNFWDLQELATDANISRAHYLIPNGKKDVDLVGKIHKGIGGGLFDIDIVELEHETKKVVLGKPFEYIMKRLEELGRDGIPYDVWVTGHSLGGGYATVFHAALLHWCAEPQNQAWKKFVPRDLITFGALRVGDKDFADGYDGLLKMVLPGDDTSQMYVDSYRRRHWRYVNGGDFVTCLPGGSYFHTDQGIRLQKDEDWRRGYPTQLPSERVTGSTANLPQPEQAEVTNWATVTRGPMNELAEAHSRFTYEPPKPISGSPNILQYLWDHQITAYWSALSVLDQSTEPPKPGPR